MNPFIKKRGLWPGVTSLSLRFLTYKKRVSDQVISKDPTGPRAASMLLKLYEEKQLSGIATYKIFSLFQPEILHLSRFYVTMGTDAVWLCNVGLIDLQAHDALQCTGSSK